MTIELLSESAVLEDRLASLEDPTLAERLVREHPSLFPEVPPEIPRTHREVLAWATRRVGTAVIAVTAAVSIAAGYFSSELFRHPTAAAPVPHPAAVALAATAHAKQPARHHAAHAAVAPVAHHAAVPVQHAAPVARYVSVSHPRPDRQALLLRAKLRAQELEIARLRAQAAAEHAAARAARAQAAVHHRLATSAAAAPQSRPQSEPAAASEPTTGTAAPGPVDAAPPSGGVKNPPTSPGGIWNERIPGGGTLGGMSPVPVGVPRDPCTPRGGRVGAVMQAVQAVQIIQSLSRGH
ncbi:MAG TPA: hypothetical protein VGC96_01020 [Candidatus Elarobacter sp.]|jgi:hypothetical protein